MKVDRAGRVYVGRRPGGLGLRARRTAAGNHRAAGRPSNLAWCDPTPAGLAITAVDAVYLRHAVQGIVPPFTPTR